MRGTDGQGVADHRAETCQETGDLEAAQALGFEPEEMGLVGQDQRGGQGLSSGRPLAGLFRLGQYFGQGLALRLGHEHRHDIVGVQHRALVRLKSLTSPA
jgi:hypothetical protein